ncbi:MAG: hypothetical protein V1709_00880 [Planctomycetota bacterium]
MKSKYYEVKIEVKDYRLIHIKAKSRGAARWAIRSMMIKDVELCSGKIKSVKEIR